MQEPDMSPDRDQSRPEDIPEFERVMRGLVGVDPAVFQWLDSYVETNGSAPDPELLWMLTWYYEIADWTFEPSCSRTIKWIRSHQPVQLPEPPPNRITIEGRGQLSAYWVSILFRK